MAGQLNQARGSVAIGSGAMKEGSGSSGDYAVAIGMHAGTIAQNNEAVAVGNLAGFDQQGRSCVAIGVRGGRNIQGEGAIAIGDSAGAEQQGQYAVAIGFQTAPLLQPANSIAIGKNATPATENSIQLKAGTTVFDVTPTEVLHNGSPIGGGLPDGLEVTYKNIYFQGDAVIPVGGYVEVDDAWGGLRGSPQGPEPYIGMGIDVSFSGLTATFDIDCLDVNSVILCPEPGSDGIWGCSTWVFNFENMRANQPVHIWWANFSDAIPTISMKYNINGRPDARFSAPETPPTSISQWSQHYYKFTTAHYWHFAEGFGPSHSSRFGKAGGIVTREEAIREFEERRKNSKEANGVEIKNV